MPENEFHLKIARELGTISAKLEALPKIETHLATLNSRVAKSEQEIGGIKTKVALVASIAGTIVTFGWDLLKTKFLG